MIFQFLALQLLSASIEPTTFSDVYCKLQANNLEKQIKVSVDKNGIGYLNETYEELNFQAIITDNKINKIQISDNASDFEITKDMLSTIDAAVDYKDIKTNKLVAFECSVNSLPKQ